MRKTQPNEIWQVDLIGRLSGTNGKNKFIFTAVDHFTKFMEAKVIEDKEATSMVNFMEELIIRKHVIPESIMSDNGLEFANKQITKLKDEYKFNWIFIHQDTIRQ